MTTSFRDRTQKLRTGKHGRRTSGGARGTRGGCRGRRAGLAGLALAATPPGGAAGLAGAAQAGAELALGAATGGSSAIKVFLLVTALSFASALIMSVTSFTRIIIVLSFLRQALGTPQLPPNPVLMGLALFLTMFIMAPTATRIHHDALGPYMDDKITATEALDRGEGP